MEYLKSVSYILSFVCVFLIQNTESSNVKIIDGNLAEIDQFPWIVSIEHRELDDDILIQCAGTLVAPNWVLTSADCLDIETSDGYMLTVKAGTIFRNKTMDHEQIQNSTEYYHHPHYDRNTMTYNVALIKLPTAFTLNEHVSLIDFYTNTIDIEKVTIIGWGTSNDSDSSSPISENLMYSLTETISNSDCQNAYSSLTSVKIDSATLCTNLDQPKTCLYDEGGPLVFQIDNTTYQVGIINPPFANDSTYLCTEFPSRYGRISIFDSWIRDVINGGLSSYINTNTLMIALIILALFK